MQGYLKYPKNKKIDKLGFSIFLISKKQLWSHWKLLSRFFDKSCDQIWTNFITTLSLYNLDVYGVNKHKGLFTRPISEYDFAVS